MSLNEMIGHEVPSSDEVKGVNPEEPDRIASVSYHPADTPDKAAAHERLRAFARGAITFIDENVPPGREKAIAFTKFEECMMWAHKSVALAGRDE